MCCCYVPLTNSRVPATRRLTRDTIERFHPPAAQRNTIQPPGTFVSDKTTNQCFVIHDQSYQHKIYNASRWFCLILLCDIWVMMVTIIAGLWPSAPWRQCLVLITFSCFVSLEQSFLEQKYPTEPEGVPVSGEGTLWNTRSATTGHIQNKYITFNRNGNKKRWGGVFLSSRSWRSS